MNQLQTTTTSFNTIELIERNGKQWIESSNLSKALGYKRSDILSKLYRNNSDEFSDDMTCTTELVFSGNLKKTVRLFSLRGAHLIAMFSRTETAKEFRKWVLDLIERESGKQPKAIEQDHDAMTKAQIYALQHNVQKKVAEHTARYETASTQKCFASLYGSIKNYYKVPSYKDIPASKFQNALNYIVDFQFDIDAPALVPAANDRAVVTHSTDYNVEALNEVMTYIEARLCDDSIVHATHGELKAISNYISMTKAKYSVRSAA